MGALLVTVAAVGTIILLLYLLDGVFSVQYVFFYLMSVFAAVLIISGVISVRVAFGKGEYIIPEIYSFFIMLVYFTKGMLQILLSWKAYGRISAGTGICGNCQRCMDDFPDLRVSLVSRTPDCAYYNACGGEEADETDRMI